MKLWAKRGLIVFAACIGRANVVALLIVKTGQQTTVSYYVELNGISPQRQECPSAMAMSMAMAMTCITTRYPNGTVFSPQDLTNPSVIKMLAERTGLDARDLSENIDVQFGTPVTSGVLKSIRRSPPIAKRRPKIWQP